ncbi:MAG: cation-translocating P-type ATPase, partial [Candidatus Competibacteraceae bacterium]|nr:cation-translocating P-type ATPase [Candidatus Competibacteraceae bacterium]
PVAAAPGTELPAGALNGTGLLEARVLRPAEEGSLGRIRRLLDSPLGTSSFIRLADRLAGRLAFLAIVLAVAGAWRAARAEGLGVAIEVALSVLLVACPCALGLATPLAFRAMRGALARRGILVRESAALEAAADVDQALLDKTGTLTESLGRLEPVAGSSALGMERMAALVAASSHPLARAVVANDRRPEDLRVVPGAGVRGRL